MIQTSARAQVFSDVFTGTFLSSRTGRKKVELDVLLSRIHPASPERMPGVAWRGPPGAKAPSATLRQG